MATFRFYNTVAVNISIGIAWLWRFAHSPVIFLGERKDWEDMEGKPWVCTTNLRITWLIQWDKIFISKIKG